MEVAKGPASAPQADGREEQEGGAAPWGVAGDHGK